MRRRDGWLRYVLVIAGVGPITGWIDGAWFPDSSVRYERGGSPYVLGPYPESGGPVTSVAALALLVPNVAAIVTRLHDRAHSAWWLLWNLVPGLGWLVLAITVELLGSDQRRNSYGPPPHRVRRISRDAPRRSAA
jgi:uncharacterized membrane protein YhaH (DUF805 family)